MVEESLSKTYIFRSPLSVQFEITHSCNNDCVFCHNDLQRQETISLSDAENIIRKLNEEQVFEVIFTGGEPLLHPNLLDMVILSKKLNMDVGLITNGILLENYVNDLVEIGIDQIQISILGYDSDSHDKVVHHEGAFKKALKGLEMLVNKKTKLPININTTLIKQNTNYIDKIYKLVKDSGATSYTVTRYVPVNKVDDLMPSISQINEVIRKMIEWSKEFRVKILNAIPYCCIEDNISIEDFKKISVGCDGGLTWATITPKGELVPCPCWHNYCGDLNNDKLSKLWKSSDFLIRLRSGKLYPVDCKSCKYFMQCRGGCRSCASSWFGELNALDPYCTENLTKKR